MAITQEFIDAVQSNKIMRVRIILKDSLLLDPTAVQFDEMERYANSQMGNLYVQHDGEKLNFDVTVWDETYLNQQMVIVVNNFSNERIQLIKDMVRYLYRDKVNKIQSERGSDYKKYEVTRKELGAGVAVAGTVLAVAGLCTSHTLLIAGGAVVAVAGVALVATDTGN